MERLVMFSHFMLTFHCPCALSYQHYLQTVCTTRYFQNCPTLKHYLVPVQCNMLPLPETKGDHF